jgi:DNA-binding NarL/FixJ family response regulator
MKPPRLSDERFVPPPIPNQSQPDTDDTEVAGKRQAPTRILIVEDDFLIAMQTENALTEAGFHVVGTATTAEQAIALAREQRPFLAVMDIRLASERDGIDTARQLFGELNVRCIFATAHDDPRTRERAEPYAPLGWLAKPYTMASLLALIMEARSKLG